MEEVADQPQQGASDARVRPDAQDPPCGCGGGGHHRSLAAGWSWLVRASRASSTSAASTVSDSRLETVTERAPRTGEAVSSRFGWPRAWGTELIRLAQVPYWLAGGSTMAWVTWRATNRTATNPTRTQGRSRSTRKSRTKIGYTSRLMVKGVTSGVNGQPLLSARSTWSRWGRKARGTTPRGIHPPGLNRPRREAAGLLVTVELFTVTS